jgi:hypothetical protein
MAAAARQRRKLPVNEQKLQLSPQHNFPFTKVNLLVFGKAAVRESV